LIRSFEAARAHLNTLSDEHSSRETELSASVRRAEAQHNQNVSSLTIKLEQAVSSFNRLDQQLNGASNDPDDLHSGGNAALRIGERLEELERQNQRALDAKRLLVCWLEVTKQGSLSTLEDMKRRQGGDGKLRCASIARQLLKISQRMEQSDAPYANGPNSANTARSPKPQNTANGSVPTNHTFASNPASKPSPREIIEKFLESLENELLQQFDTHYRRQNFDGMRECATALRDFNDGASVTSLFLNQHSFFIDRGQLVNEEIGDADT